MLIDLTYFQLEYTDVGVQLIETRVDTGFYVNFP